MTPPDDDTTILTECTLDAPQERVWRALSRPEIVADWLGAEGFRPEPGARFGLPAEGGRPAIACEVISAEPPRRLSYAWREPAARPGEAPRDSVVTIDLAPAGPERTRLRILHAPVLARSSRRPPVASAIRASPALWRARPTPSPLGRITRMRFAA